MDTDIKAKIAQNRLKIKNSLKATIKTSTLENVSNNVTSHSKKSCLDALSPSTSESLESSLSKQG